jgi:hypothetical protein
VDRRRPAAVAAAARGKQRGGTGFEQHVTLGGSRVSSGATGAAGRRRAQAGRRAHGGGGNGGGVARGGARRGNSRIL